MELPYLCHFGLHHRVSPASLRTSSREVGGACSKASVWWSLSALPAGPLCSSKCSSRKEKHVQQSDSLEVKHT